MQSLRSGVLANCSASFSHHLDPRLHCGTHRRQRRRFCDYALNGCDHEIVKSPIRQLALCGLARQGGGCILRPVFNAYFKWRRGRRRSMRFENKGSWRVPSHYLASSAGHQKRRTNVPSKSVRPRSDCLWADADCAGLCPDSQEQRDCHIPIGLRRLATLVGTAD